MNRSSSSMACRPRKKGGGHDEATRAVEVEGTGVLDVLFADEFDDRSLLVVGETLG